MANVTRNVTFTKSAYAKEVYPNNVYQTNSGTEYNISSDAPGDPSSWNKIVFGGVNSWPASLKRNRIVSARLRMYIKTGYQTLYMRGCEDFTPSTVTFRNFPATRFNGTSRDVTAADLGLSQGVWSDVWLPLSMSSSESVQASLALDLLTHGAVQFYGGMWSSLGPAWYMKTVLSGGSAPYAEITYSNSEIITSKVEIVKNLSSTIYPNAAQAVSWKLVKNSSNFCVDETWTQSSAKFRWRVQGASSWNDINVSGSNTQTTIPAYTFPTGKTIEYCIQCTDTDGTTTTTSTYTTTTPASQITQQNSPTSGYKNPREAITFAWYFANVAGNYAQQSASLFWRETGADSWTEVQASGSTMSVTVPANTFPTASSVEWYLSGTDSSGSASQTPVYSFSTTASTAYAIAVSPINTVEDGSAPITFRWSLQSADGLEMSLINLWWKLPSESSLSWHVIKSSTEIITEWTVAADYFPAGEIQWLVHAYNIDGTRGPDSITSFTCVAAPEPVRGLAATPVPLTTISWQSTGQQAYEVSIDGEVVQKAFGPAVYSWAVNEPLMPGEHAISVRIQGIYGLWSQPAETSIQVGGPSDELTLIGEFGADAVLSLSDDTDGQTVRWYRDGILIGTSHGSADGARFVDRRTLGEHRYFARTFDGSGGYAESNAVTGTTKTNLPLIGLLDGEDWITLRLTEESNGSEGFTWTMTSARIHVAGAAYPVLETSPYRDASGSYSCSFRYEEEARAFEALRGKTVILKSRRGNVIVGAITQLSKRERRFYTSYSFTLQRIHWEDFVAYDS